MYNDTPITQFKRLSKASANVTAGETAAVTTYALSYPTACVHSNWPSNSYQIETATGANYAVLQFLLCDTAGDSVDGRTGYFTLWGKSAGTSGAVLLFTASLLAGSAVIGTAAAPGVSPADGTANVGQWGYVDGLEFTVNNIGAWTKPALADAANGIAQVFFDPKGIKSLFGDWDLDAGAGTTPDDAMAIIREY